MKYTDDVNGIIIGGFTHPYEFWTKDEPFGQHKIDHGGFESDEEAIAWFKERHPAEFKKGVEMRVYDRG